MSVIKIKAVDQTLTITNAPMIAAGDINTDFVIFTFDSAWDGFEKLAVFFRDDNKENVFESAIDSTGKSVVPHEVTATDGKIWIGVVGVNGSNVLTSQVIWYEIVNGVYTNSLASATPWANTYEQMLTIAEQLQALYNVLIADQEAFEESVETRINNLVIANTTNASGFELYTLFEEVTSSNGKAEHTFNNTYSGKVLEVAWSYVGDIEWRTDNVILSENGTLLTVTASDAGMTGPNVYLKLELARSKTIDLAELTDIRLGYDGTVYESAGAAVRAQIDAINGRLTNESISALITLLSKVVYIDGNGQKYLNNLEKALNKGEQKIKYTVTNNLTNATNDNVSSFVYNGNSYIANIEVPSGYELQSVIVTMGGTDITSNVYGNGTIQIPAVTGAIVITAAASPVYVTVKELSSSDFQYQVGLNETGPNYSQYSGSRTSHVDFDIPIEYGYIYKFEYESIVSGLRVGLPFYNQIALDAVANDETFSSSNKLDNGWKTSGWEFEVPEMINNSPIRRMRITFDNGTQDCVTRFVISRKVVE